MYIFIGTDCVGPNKKGKPGIAPLQPPTLAAFRPWGIQQELVVQVCRRKGRVIN